MAIFKRGTPRGTWKKLKEALWPSMGWVRTVDYYRHRIFRTGDSTYKIATGMATGIAVSFTPFLGTHFLQAAFFSWLLRGNMIAGMLATWFGNPWTFPFIFWLTYHVGVWLCGLFGLGGFVILPDGLAFGSLINEPLVFFDYLFSNPLTLLLPLTVGGILCGILSWPVAYVVLYYPVRQARRVYRAGRVRRRKKRRVQQQEKSP